MTASRFAVVGSGWRTHYFARIARALPDRFRLTGLVSRDAGRRQALAAQWDVATHPSLQALLTAGRPDFLVLSVAQPAMPALLAEAAAAGLPILAETPPAPDLPGLHTVWGLAKAGARIQVAEQYLYQPLNAARLAVIADGRLGPVSQVQISLAHGYHAISLLRRMLDVGGEPARITARTVIVPALEGPGREGPPREHRVFRAEQVIAQLEFPGKFAIHDFTAGQYRSWIRTNRLLVRGERGEIKDSELRYLQDFRTPIATEFRRMDTGRDGHPEIYAHDGIMAGDSWVYRTPFPAVSLSDDEIAGATALQKMAESLDGGPGPYSLAEAAQDQYLALAMEQARTSGQPIVTERQPWTDDLS